MRIMGKPPQHSSHRPFVVGVLGLKKSGKTTVAEALISGLTARGIRVAAVKTSHLARLDLDPGKRDSRQLYDAGAICIVAQSQRETLIVRRHDQPVPFQELLHLVPREAAMVVVEGGVAAQADAVLVCLRNLQELEETLSVREVPKDKVRALSGLAAARAGEAGRGKAATPAESSDQDGMARLPLLDACAAEGREALIQLVLAEAGCAEKPEAATSGPKTS